VADQKVIAFYILDRSSCYETLVIVRDTFRLNVIIDILNLTVNGIERNLFTLPHSHGLVV
jgi:hypothetical protein